MRKIIGTLVLAMLPFAGLADAVVPTRTIRANDTISRNDVTVKDITKSDAFSRAGDVIGQEARTTLYAGRPILFDDVGPPALVTRNQIVSLKYVADGLVIMTEGRALQRGGIGDRVRIMNLDSRATLFGRVEQDGSVRVFN